MRGCYKLVCLSSPAERVVKEHRKIAPLVHLELVGSTTQTDEQLQKAEVIQEIDFYCTTSYGVPCQVCFVRAWLDMQSCFIFCCYGEENLLSRIASAVSSPRVGQRHQPVNYRAMSLTLHWAWRWEHEPMEQLLL